MFLRTYARWLVSLAAVMLAGCQPQSETRSRAPGEGLYTIVTTVGMVTDIVREVAGDRAEVIGLLSERADPHLYKPTRDDLNKLMEADVVFYAGLTLEGRMTDMFTKVARSGVPVYAVSECIEESYLRTPPEFRGHHDPHVWMDVSAWSQCVAEVARALSEFDPEHADGYRERAEAYRKQLTALDEYARSAIATIPERQRVLITAHDAFGYFGRAYDIEVKALQGITTESEASVDDVNQLVDFIVERGIKSLFVETSVNQEGIKAILEGAKSRGSAVEICPSELFSDAMGPPGSYEGTYIGMLDHNVTKIVRALGGDAPERGLNGKLDAAAYGE